MYDLLIVGAGLTAATLAAQLKGPLSICVMDCRSHLGGNCFDHVNQGTLIHRYGPHIFHCPSPRILAFLSRFAEWEPYTHTVTAEIREGDELWYVPFPYCKLTRQYLGRELSPQEILDRFFRDYSRKMWGMDWEDLPATVRGRVPKNSAETPAYYRNHFAALPKQGYTRLLENMLDGVTIMLGASPTAWTQIRSKTVIYTGRPDLIPLPGQTVSIGEAEGLQLDFRTLDIALAPEEWGLNTVSLHACTLERPWTRKTCYARMTGGQSPLVSTETPRQATAEELAPYYPIELPAPRARMFRLKQRIEELYPHMHLLGRLGTFRYLDMYQAVGQALSLARRCWPV
jgi:UDP-galactopyranose mutase